MPGERNPWQPGRGEKDQRRWRTIKYDGPVPDPVAQAVENAIDLALVTGKASNRVEAHEAIAVSATTEWMEEVHAMERGAPADAVKAQEYYFRRAVKLRDGYRCQWSGTSQNLTVHHIRSRGWCRKEGQMDLLYDPDNGITLTHQIHEQIQPRWFLYVDRFQGIVAANKEAAEAPFDATAASEGPVRVGRN